MDNWEKAKTITFMVSSIAAAIAAWIIPFKVEKVLGDNQTRARYVETAVKILTQNPTEDTINLREWAVAIINENSSVKLNTKTKEDLIKKLPIVETSGSLDAKSYFGKIVFFSRNEPEGITPGERVCALNLSYPWGASHEILRSYLGKKVYISAEGFLDRSLEFRVIGFLESRSDDGRMIQVPVPTLEDLVGESKFDEMLRKGLVFGKVSFPSR